jgi:hypothetical protein
MASQSQSRQSAPRYDHRTVHQPTVYNDAVTYSGQEVHDGPVVFNEPVTINASVVFNGPVVFQRAPTYDERAGYIQGRAVFNGPVVCNASVTLRGTVAYNGPVVFANGHVCCCSALMSPPQADALMSSGRQLPESPTYASSQSHV